MQTSRRRFFALASTVALAAAVAPKTLKAQADITTVPVEVFDVEKWEFVPLEGGLRNIKKGQIFRRTYEGQHIPDEVGKEEVKDGETAWWGLATEDGHTSLDANGKMEGGCYADFYETHQAWTDAGIRIG